MSSNIVSLSGGKDSTAMLLMMLERGEDVAEIVFFDGGWEFSQMYDHLEKLERFTGRKITRLHPRLPVGAETGKKSFDYFFADYPITKRGSRQVHKIGYGWPGVNVRWCTGFKTKGLHAYHNALSYQYPLPIIQCIGFAADEWQRAGRQGNGNAYINNRFPLVEWGITEHHALQYCRKRGFDWGGLYDVFGRVSCFCCPLGGISKSRKIWQHYPELWAKMLEMESWLPDGNVRRRFISHGPTISDLQSRFAYEGSTPLLYRA